MNAGESLRRLRERKPLIHQITNYVVMNETANATLALGALPVMAHAREEVEEMVGFAGALDALGNLASSEFIALVAPLAALLAVALITRGTGDASGQEPAREEALPL